MRRPGRRNRRAVTGVQVPVRRALALLCLALALAACGDDVDEVGSGGGSEPAGEPAATFEGTIAQVTAFEPVTEGCTPPEDLDPDGAVSSDDPPICTDPETAPLGSILVIRDEANQVVFTIRQDTVLTADGEPIGFDDLAAGDLALVGFDGRIAESFPGQASADSVDVRPG